MKEASHYFVFCTYTCRMELDLMTLVILRQMHLLRILNAWWMVPRITTLQIWWIFYLLCHSITVSGLTCSSSGGTALRHRYITIKQKLYYSFGNIEVSGLKYWSVRTEISHLAALVILKCQDWNKKPRVAFVCPFLFMSPPKMPDASVHYKKTSHSSMSISTGRI